MPILHHKMHAFPQMPFICYSFKSFSFFHMLKEAMKVSYYAVARGRKLGIFKTWEECRSSVEGFPNARHKKFLREEEALEFIRANRPNEAGGNFKRHEAVVVATSSSTNANPAVQQQQQDGGHQQFQHARQATGRSVVYTDGACSNNGKYGAKAGIGVFWGDSHPDNVSEPVDGKPTNNRAEYLAIICAMERAVQRGLGELVIRTDSDLLIKSMTRWLKKWKRNGWKTSKGTEVANQELLERIDQLMGRVAVQFEKVAGHSGDYGNDRADQLAREGAERYGQ